MNFDELFEIIESPAFAAHLTVASDLKTFLRAARRQEAIESLTEDMTKSGGMRLVERISEVRARSFDETLQNPCDVAVAIYLWLLSSIDKESSRNAATMFARAGGKWWWAKQMASEILEARTNQLQVTPVPG